MIEYLITYKDESVDKGEAETLEHVMWQIDRLLTDAGFVFKEMKCITIINIGTIIGCPPSDKV